MGADCHERIRVPFAISGKKADGPDGKAASRPDG
jgi:hypothetical protein